MSLRGVTFVSILFCSSEFFHQNEIVFRTMPFQRVSFCIPGEKLTLYKLHNKVRVLLPLSKNFLKQNCIQHLSLINEMKELTSRLA